MSIGDTVRVKTFGRYYDTTHIIKNITDEGIELTNITRLFSASELEVVCTLKYPCIAVDLDDTLVESITYPYISSINLEAISVLREYQSLGGEVIAFSCRSDNDLALAIEAISEHGFKFDAINEDTQTSIDRWLSIYPGATMSPKPWCSLYIDDKAWPCNLIGIDWKKIRETLLTRNN